MKQVILLIVCLLGLAIGGETLTVDTGTFTTAIYPETWQYYGWGAAEYSDTTCELCGKAIAVQTKEAEQSWSFCDTAASTRQWPISSDESRSCVLPWRFEIQHSFCNECAGLADKELRNILTIAHDGFWKELIKKKAKDKAARNEKRKDAYRSSLEEKIAELQTELKTIDKEIEK